MEVMDVTLACLFKMYCACVQDSFQRGNSRFMLATVTDVTPGQVRTVWHGA
jgi:hypothetical protein